jgi:D-beta-D-heptose 7-phosphate kinase/D-beta-D-heptose 1-phosphate adenosyltransferase
MIDYYGAGGDWSPLPTTSSYVWTNGCYDILHVGHLRLLEECNRQVRKNPISMLMVGIDSDKRVKELKGKTRPINNQLTRAEMLLSIKGVDGVFIYDTTEELDSILAELTPKVMVIGEEYKNKTVVGGQYCSTVVFFPKVEDLSTTNLISHLKEAEK